jgi:hypothetical protein
MSSFENGGGLLKYSNPRLLEEEELFLQGG